MTFPLIVLCFQTEIAPPKIRGFVVGLAQQMIGIGFIVANWVICFDRQKSVDLTAFVSRWVTVASLSTQTLHGGCLWACRLEYIDVFVFSSWLTRVQPAYTGSSAACRHPIPSLFPSTSLAKVETQMLMHKLALAARARPR